jgi:hypothetical protein
MFSLDPGLASWSKPRGRGASRKVPWGSALQFIKHRGEKRVAAGGGGRPGRVLIWNGLRGNKEAVGRAGEERIFGQIGRVAGARKGLTPEGVSYRAARRVAGVALSPNVWLR